MKVCCDRMDNVLVFIPDENSSLSQQKSASTKRIKKEPGVVSVSEYAAEELLPCTSSTSHGHRTHDDCTETSFSSPKRVNKHIRFTDDGEGTIVVCEENNSLPQSTFKRAKTAVNRDTNLLGGDEVLDSLQKPTAEQIAQLEDAGISLKHGAFSVEEDDAIRANFHAFAQLHEVHDSSWLLGFGGRSMWTAEERKAKRSFLKETNFVQHLRAGLSGRTGISVYQRARRLLDPTATTTARYTKADDTNLMALVERYGHDWIKIGELMERTHHSVKCRHAKLTALTGAFSRKEDQQLIASVKTVTGIQEHVEVGSIDSSKIDWPAVARHMESSRPPKTLKEHWVFKLRPKLKPGTNGFVRGAQKDCQLTKMVKQSRAHCEAEVPWTEIGDEIGRMDSMLVKRHWARYKRVYCPEYREKKFSRIARKVEKVIDRTRQVQRKQWRKPLPGKEPDDQCVEDSTTVHENIDNIELEQPPSPDL